MNIQNNIMKIDAIVQARMGSKRLPGKAMLNIEGKPLIGHIFDRLKRVKRISKIFLATTTDNRNDLLVDYAKHKKIEFYRHKEENDIIGRLNKILVLSQASAFLKVNGDCPLIDPKILNKGILNYNNNPSLDMITNKLSNTFPLGFSYEIISTQVIKWCNVRLKSKEDRELAMLWIMKNKKKFPNQIDISYKKKYGNYNLCVDTKEDFKLICNIFRHLYKKNNYFGIEEVISFLKSSANK